MLDSARRDSYRRARKLFSKNLVAEALDLLDQVERAYPNTPHVMFSRAVCMARLGRLDEARALCNMSEAMHGDAAARELRGKIDSYKAATAPTIVLPQYEEAAPGTPPWVPYMTGAVVVIFTFLGVLAFLRGCGESPTAVSTPRALVFQPAANSEYFLAPDDEDSGGPDSGGEEGEWPEAEPPLPAEPAPAGSRSAGPNSGLAEEGPAGR